MYTWQNNTALWNGKPIKPSDLIKITGTKEQQQIIKLVFKS